MPSPDTADAAGRRGLRRAAPRRAGSGTSAPTASGARSTRASTGSGWTAIDIVYLHDPDDHWDAGVRRRACRRSIALREQGVVDAIGVGMNQSAMPAEFVRRHDIDLVMLRRPVHPARPERARRPARRSRRSAASAWSAAGVYNSGLLSAPRPAAGAHVRLPSRRRRSSSTAPGASPRSARRTASTCPTRGVAVPAAASGRRLGGRRRPDRGPGPSQRRPARDARTR